MTTPFSVPAQPLDVAVAPYKYNPSAWKQRVPIALFALVAAGICLHMALFQWGIIQTVWDPVFGYIPGIIHAVYIILRR